MDWRVVAGKADPEMFAVEGGYLVADNLPIEDAHLIAAAPDMLEAIKAFLPSKISSGNRSVPDDIVIPLDVTVGELRRLEAAIAKATGSQA